MLVAHKWFVVVLLFSWNISEERKIVEFLREETPANCRPEGSYALNKCHERCECRNGKLINCYRVRKDFIKWTSTKDGVFSTRTRWRRRIRLSKETIISWSLFISPPQTICSIHHPTSFSHGTDGSWLSSRIFCAESTVASLFRIGTGAELLTDGGAALMTRTSGAQATTG